MEDKKYKAAIQLQNKVKNHQVTGPQNDAGCESKTQSENIKGKSTATIFNFCITLLSYLIVQIFPLQSLFTPDSQLVNFV